AFGVRVQDACWDGTIRNISPSHGWRVAVNFEISRVKDNLGMVVDRRGWKGRLVVPRKTQFRFRIVEQNGTRKRVRVRNGGGLARVSHRLLEFDRYPRTEAVLQLQNTNAVCATSLSKSAAVPLCNACLQPSPAPHRLTRLFCPPRFHTLLLLVLSAGRFLHRRPQRSLIAAAIVLC
ncbi:hypothetical protein HK096_006092, partial [Nowakowskiella sp. JEL0078]